MRKVAKHAFHVSTQVLPDRIGSWHTVEETIEAWLRSKGTREDRDGQPHIRYTDGRLAKLTIRTIRVEEDESNTWILEEPTDGGTFTTTVSVLITKDVLAVACDLEVITPVQVIAPVYFDAHCPRALREILNLGIPWVVRSTKVSAKPRRFREQDGGEDLARLIQCADRALPLVLVSEYDGLVLHPGIAEGLANDLAGLAIVGSASSSASWTLSRHLGTEWSCYNGAIRIYWPLNDGNRDPLRHPLWTPQRLLFGVDGTEEAARRIRKQFRRKIMGLSTIAIRRHPAFDELDYAARRKQLEDGRKHSNDLQKTIEGYEKQILDLLEKIEESEKEVADLKEQLATAIANTTLVWAQRQEEGSEDVVPAEEAPPETVEAAVQRARSNHQHLLVFGNDVARGVRELDTDAGPPEKVLDYLDGLAALSRARRSAPLGMNMVQWLARNNYSASGEAELTKSSKKERQKRTWNDGEGRRIFDLHMKPNESGPPSKIVRIYFDWDEANQRIIVGWVGRHPK